MVVYLEWEVFELPVLALANDAGNTLPVFTVLVGNKMSDMELQRWSVGTTHVSLDGNFILCSVFRAGLLCRDKFALLYSIESFRQVQILA